MKKGQIITIGRELGSGGREIGMELAKRLDIPFYDSVLLDEAAKKSGFSREIFEKHDERPTNSFLYALAMGMNSIGSGYQRPLMLDVYLAQFNTMKKLADEGPGVFIGRCADYVLADRDPLFNVFIHADMATRIKRTAEKHSVSEKMAEKLCLRADKDRASYYNYYSDHAWGDGRCYDLCLNAGKLGIEKSVEIILSCL
ncbi:MAG: cytidylate kinase-like family protein [Lachnospiraceae bacterium]|nr:cytidylate kinase-like family protein [Lachnospiraceae bacterium]